MSDSQTHQTNLQVLYAENNKFHRHILDWRHRIILRFFLTNGALIIGFGWMWNKKADSLIESLLFIPFLIGSILSFCFFLLDRRNSRLMALSSEVGRELEKELFPKGGYLSRFGEFGIGKAGKMPHLISYTMVLGFVYLTTSILFLGISIIVFFNLTI